MRAKVPAPTATQAIRPSRATPLRPFSATADAGERERLSRAAQLGDATRFGHSLGAVRVHHKVPPVVEHEQGRPRPTMQMKGVPSNDDVGLERDADPMGAKVISTMRPESFSVPVPVMQRQQVVQREDADWNNGWAATALGVRLTHGIDPGAPPAEILGGLMDNFRGLGGDFTYDKHPGDHMAFLGGEMRGDCGTLARAFKAIGEGYYQIPDIEIQQWGGCWVQAGATPYGGSQPDCDGGTSWIFGSHTWARHDGTTYDILFCDNNLAPHALEDREVRSIFFPQRSYSRMDDGSITYPVQMQPAPVYRRIPPDLASKVKFVLRNGPFMLLRALGRLLVLGLEALAGGIGWIVNKISAWLGNNDDDEGWGALGGLGDQND